MKKLLLFSLIVSFIILSTTAFAAEKAPLGAGNLALKVDYINFTDQDMEDFDTDSGAYFGIEAYSQVADASPNLYVGMEVGVANIDGDISGTDTETTFVPIELNLKYALKITPEVTIDIGAGPSVNYAKLESDSVSSDNWMIGGQAFVDLSLKLHQFFVGINAKYQIMENFNDSDVSLRNWRIGGQAGIMF